VIIPQERNLLGCFILANLDQDPVLFWNINAVEKERKVVLVFLFNGI
jgi:hypothetical protein